MTTTVTTASYGPIIANGAAPIPFTFQSLSTTEIEVVRDDEVVSPSAYILQRNTDGTGSVTPLTTWSGSRVVIRSAPTFKQPTDFSRYGVFFPDQLNGPLDRLARYILALLDRIVALEAAVAGISLPPITAIYFPATGFWDDTEIWSDTALWKDA